MTTQSLPATSWWPSQPTPGWTPLFVNAASVVLEVGGVLQHGALVAREYGKPCVVGISDVFARLEDGQWVEVDGVAATVRLLDSSLPQKS
ncbi:PEP-utilizing enzyme [Telluria beijingensis]|uniref:PEP-utilizing enzyme n=1 Tax=Telluria beijingensis TaxID=3068633 RepID=UPI0027954D50|nr:PEP-utilizing enzyme [Massilia sp. REN29]